MISLEYLGIENVKEIKRNPSYDELYKDETEDSLTGYERSVLTKSGALDVSTGIFTGRSPKDKYIVVDEN